MHIPEKIMRRSLHLILLLPVIALVTAFAWHAMSPGRSVTEGRADLRTNGIWLQHGWIGDDEWFLRNRRDRSKFRNDARIGELAHLLAGQGVRDVFPHLCPCMPTGRISPADFLQTKRFLDGFSGFRVLPWIGGALGKHCFPESPEWRQTFVTSVVELLDAHPRLAGIHLNIEPMPDGSKEFLMLLDELRRALPRGKIISVAAFPPPTVFHPYPEVHWGKTYYGEVARRSDQMVPMLYNTSIRSGRLYRHQMRVWAVQALDWSGRTEVLFGVPAYDDPGVGYHDADTENLENALSGIHAGLETYRALPENYAGVSIYSEWEMDKGEWAFFRREFGSQ
ncbi:MAG: hypothetical protein FJZ79_03420 [Chlorobi bacterium]|nr:hypothetical protein [Chlorobiota bacterium]